MKPAPFLTGLRVQLPESESASDAQDTPTNRGQTSESATGDDWDKDDFPAWYQDRLSDDDPPDHNPNEGAESTETAGSDEGASADGPSYPFDLAAVQHLDKMKFGTVTVLAGDNGSGKSTLIEAIAVAAGFNAEGGSRNLRFNTYDTHSELCDHLVLEWTRRPRWGWFLRAETFYGMANHITRDDDPDAGVAAIFPDLHNRSHGESFLTLAASRFTGAGLYLFDEPESALSIQGQITLASMMTEALTKGAQFIVSTHSPLFMAFPDAVLYQLDQEQGLEAVAFEDLTSSILWRRFFADPASFYDRLVAPSD